MASVTQRNDPTSGSIEGTQVKLICHTYIQRRKHWIVKSHRDVAGLSGDVKQTQRIDVTSKPKNSND